MIQKKLTAKKRKRKYLNFKKRENKKIKNGNGNEKSPLLSIKIDFKNLMEKQNDNKAKDIEKKDQ